MQGISEYLDRTRAQYHHLRERLRKAAVRQSARRGSPAPDLQYSLAEYRGWVSGKLGSDGGGATRCAYCQVPLGLLTMVPDHRIPLARGGDLTLANLAPACEECNDSKGALTDKEFIDLREALYAIGTYALTNVMSRLAKAEKLASVHRRVMAQSKAEGVVELLPI